MIKINFYKNALVVTGHANYSSTNDVVCAGVSSIVMGALNWFDQNKVNIYISSGFIKLIIDPNDKQYKSYLELINIQLLAIISNKEYANFISIKNNNFNLEGENNE